MFHRRNDMTVAAGSRTQSGAMEALESRTLMAAPTAAIADMWTDASSATIVVDWTNAAQFSLGNGDLQISANGRAPIVGTMVGAPVLVNNKLRVAYRFAAYDNAWGVTDTGTYSIVSPTGQVVSPQADPVANPLITTRGLWFNTPKARLVSQTMRDTDWLIVIQYDTINGLNTGTLDATDLTLANGANGGISLYQVVPMSATSTRVVYQVKAFEGAWSWAANGLFRFTIGANKVADAGGRQVPAHTYADFNPFFTAPRAAVQPTVINENDWLIPIRYNALPGTVMKPDTLVTVGVIHVTSTNGNYDADGVFAGLVNHGNGSYTVTYRVTANGGSWDFRDNGSYALQIRANRASDINSHFVPAYTLQTFGLWFSTPAAEVVTPSAPTFTRWDLNIRFRDDVQIDRNTINANSIRVVGPDGLELSFSLISISGANPGAVNTALFRALMPGGFQNGQYQVFLNRDGVRDSAGRIAAENLLGTFTMNFP